MEYKNFDDIVTGEELIDSEDRGYSLHLEYIFVREKREKSFIYDSVIITNRDVRILWNNYEVRYKDDQWLEKELKKNPRERGRSFSIERKKIKELNEHYKRISFHHLFENDKNVLEINARKNKIPIEDAENHEYF